MAYSRVAALEDETAVRTRLLQVFLNLFSHTLLVAVGAKVKYFVGKGQKVLVVAGILISPNKSTYSNTKSRAV